jgi:cobalt-zinc-cadmium resistance protein CzcA
VEWDLSSKCRDDFLEPFSTAEGEGLVKLFGKDLEALERLAQQVEAKLTPIEGIEQVRVVHVWGQVESEYRVDLEKCARWGTSAADVNVALQLALAGKPVAQLLQGEKSLDITLRWPPRLCADEEAILNQPFDIPTTARPGEPPDAGAPRLRLKDLLTPVNEAGAPDPNGGFARFGASVIYRENGQRLIAVRFAAHGRALTSVLADARAAAALLLKGNQRVEWEGQ